MHYEGRLCLSFGSSRFIVFFKVEKLFNTTWVVFQQGVFHTGNFQKFGELEIVSHNEAAIEADADAVGPEGEGGANCGAAVDSSSESRSSAGSNNYTGSGVNAAANLATYPVASDQEVILFSEKLEYRPVIEDPTLVNEFIFAGTKSRRRYQARFAETLQGGVFMELDNGSLKRSWILVKKEIVRTIGEKLLSTLY
jgi:hypothetical protein